MEVCEVKMSVPGTRCNTVWSCKTRLGTLEERKGSPSSGSGGPPGVLVDGEELLTWHP